MYSLDTLNEILRNFYLEKKKSEPSLPDDFSRWRCVLHIQGEPTFLCSTMTRHFLKLLFILSLIKVSTEKKCQLGTSKSLSNILSAQIYLEARSHLLLFSVVPFVPHFNLYQTQYSCFHPLATIWQGTLGVEPFLNGFDL